jgi:hypothetical protein
LAEILDFEQQRRRLAARRGFAAWSRCFPDPFDEQTPVEALSDPTLRTLIQGGDDSSLLLYELIMGIMRLGKGAKFHDLESHVKLEIMDITLFLLDQLRFEVMRRLGWVEPSLFVGVPIFDLVEDFAGTYAPMKNHTPALLRSHPRFHEYLEVFEGDRSVFIRKLVPEALELFQEGNEGA